MLLAPAFNRRDASWRSYRISFRHNFNWRGDISDAASLIFRWAKTKPAAATSAVFILVNSASGLLGYFSNQQPFPRSHGPWR